ncbi:epiplakin [Podarcis muralis]
MEARGPGTRGPAGSAAMPGGYISPSSTSAAPKADPHIKSIAGVYVEAASGKTMSLNEAVQHHLLQPDVASALLEAQAATGGIVDLAGKRLVSVAEALEMGLAGLEMKEKLLCAERAAKGFTDPYTEEKISLYQALQKELLGREQGLYLLEAQLATGGTIEPATGHRIPPQEAYEKGYLDEKLSNFLSDPENEEAKGFLDPNNNQKVTYTELMRRCICDHTRGLLLLPLKISFPGLRGSVCSHELLDAGIIDSDMFKALHDGELTAQEVAEMDSVQGYLSGTKSIAGVALLHTNECKSLYQALAEHLLVPGTAVILLQAQAATGCLIDPVRNEKFTADAAIRAGVVGPELHQKLSSAEKAVTGYKDPFTGETVSLFQAMKKGLVPRDPGIFLLDAQFATGGIIDPHTHHRLPVEMACQRGHLDKDTESLFCNPTDEIRGFFEPNSREKLSYAELLLRCVTDPDTGLCLLPLSGGHGREHFFINHNTKSALENMAVSVSCGKFKGKHVSLWKLLFSDYFTGEQRTDLIQQYLSRRLSARQLADKVSHTIQQAVANSRVTFEGLRDKVTPAQLLSSDIINKNLFEKLTQGETLAKDVVSMGTVKKYLEGTGSISGLLLPDSQEKISIYQAKRKGFLRPGTSLILLEAQAATGYIIDPAANKKYSVDEALKANVIGPDVYDKLLTAEKAVTGYRDPYTGEKISLFQAMMKDLIIRDHAIRLLEAQIATGGIIDPVNSHRLPVEVAYKRGYFDKKMNLILSDPSDDTKGFFDPNTHENLTYLQLKEKCIIEPSTSLCLLPLNSKKPRFIDETTKQAFRGSSVFVKYGRFQGQRLSLWDLLNSEYFSEGKRREIFNHYCLQKVTLEKIRLMLEEEMKKWACIQFPAIRGRVTAYHLMEMGIIDRTLFERLLEGAVSPEEVLRMGSVRKYLYGTGSIGGIVLQPSNERVSLYEAMKRNIVVPGVAVPLLEAQAATGFIVDPVKNKKLGLDEAVKEGLVGPELYEKLQRAEEAVTGYKDPFTGKKISLFQAMKKGLVADKQARQLMDAQLSTGGVIDPHCGHYVPVEFAQKKGYLDEDFSKTLSNPSSGAKTFSTLDRKEMVTYSQLIDQCQKDEASGVHLLPLPQAASPATTDEQIKQLFRETYVQGKRVSLWELLNSGYFTEEQRRDFLEKYRSEAISLQELVTLVQELIKEMELKAQSQVTFQGLRGAVPAVWLLDTGIISEKIFRELAQGRRTAREVSEMDSVKKYLQGTGSIAGVFIQASNEKMSIYQAMQKSLLLPGTGARLLEAQAATGSIMDPVTNQRLGAEEAIKAGIVGEELVEQLLQAERALTGYPDPYSGKPISVYQAIRKELISTTAGIPLLEAQLATGGVIDPIHHLHLPLQAAYKHNFYDEEMHKTLSQQSDDTCVFFDPNTQESLTYQQLKERCVRDAETGHLLLPLSEEATFYADQQTMEVLKSVTVGVNIGRFKGQEASLWDLLHSEYITHSKRRELVAAYKEGNTEILDEIAVAASKVIEDTDQQSKRFTFKGLRKQVSASDLFQSELIDKETLDELREGKKTVQEVTKMDSVSRYLEGCNFIAGVLLQPSQERLSIYQAMRQSLLRPGAALVLLEAQAATGFLLDPVRNKKLSVDEALAGGLIGREIYEKLLSAEKAVTGYTHPYTKEQISLFEAMNEGLIVKSHGIRLLEAQIATGGIIDPVHSHRIPVEVAYKRGYFDEKLNQVLLDPTDDTQGFFDPNTHENLTYLQLLERCTQDPETGLYMLQIVKRGGRYFYINEATKKFLQAQPMQMHIGRYKGQTVSMWDLLCSPYIQEQRRKELVRQYKFEGLTLEQLSKAITAIIEETEQQMQALKVKGPRGDVSAAELFNSEIIDKKTLDGLQQGPGALQQLAQKDSVKRYLEGTGCIAGVLAAKGQKMTIYEAMKKGVLSPEHGLMLLEAQAATGFIIDPLKKKTFSVDQAISVRLVGEDLREKLLSAEKAVTGYTDPSTGNKISLFQAMKKSIVEKELALRLLEAQIATGGIIDPVHGHRIPVEVAYKRECLDEGTYLRLSDPKYATKGFVDPNTQERITYAQLLHRCTKETGVYLLQLLSKRDYFYVDEITKNILSSTKVNVTLGKFRGQIVSLWDLLTSSYFTEEKRNELIKKYKLESSAVLQHITDEILNIIKEKEENRRDIWFQGLRKQVTASELLKAEIIGKETLKSLEEGKQTAKDVAKIDSVRRYLEGTSCIAGVLVPSKTDPSKTEKMSIYQAMWKNVLRPGTALVLLEAQAATGFIIDPLKNERLSVDEAISARLVGGEIHNKLLCAEKAVTGYTDPNTGKKISLFQAMKKDLIIKEHGIRLLEAQIATGGIIDPVNSHRVPVEVAYKRGYFDEKMNQILSDPTDDTKGFFDPNTHENLTYMQLLKRCVHDTETGLMMLQIQDQTSIAFSLDENIKKTLRSTTTRVNVGDFQGQVVSLWDLLFSKYITENKSQELIRLYKSGKKTIEEMIATLISTIKEKEEQSINQQRKLEHETVHLSFEENWQKTLKSTTLQMPAGPQRGQTVTVWDLLFSNYITEEKRAEFLDLYKRGMISVDRLIHVLTTLVRKKEATSRKLDIKVRSTSKDDPEREEEEEKDDDEEEEEEEMDAPVLGEKEVALKSRKVKVTASAFHGREVSVWDVLHSKYIPEEKRKELLQCYKSGILTIDQMETVVTAIVNKTEEEKTKEASHSPSGSWEEPLRNHTVVLHVGEFQGQEVSLWDLLFSQYVPEAQREELFTKYRSGILSIQEMIVTLAPLLTETGGSHGGDGEAPRSPSRETSSHEEELESALRRVTVEVPSGKFKGHRQSAWELLFSKYVTADKRRELLEKYRGGSLTSEELVRRITILIEEMEEKSNKLKFSGLRRQVTASELFNSEIIDKETLSELTHGTKTVEEVTERDSVKRYLEGTSCIAGVLVPSRSDPSKMEKMTIYQAMWKGFLRPGTALVLLEAQAATGFMTDPLKNEKLSVDEAVSAELVGAELKEKLLSAERAVTGYNDPYTGNKISLFQAMKKGLIVKDHGIRLLEAQIATGGIIDPVQSHRLPVNVAYKRGFFDEEMNRVLSDPSDDTKGFFDPNTHENLTYLQLRHRCLPDPETGLLMLQVLDKGSFSFYLNDRTRKALQSAKTRVGVGLFEGQDVSAWDLLFSRYISPHKRMELLKQYKAGTLTLEEITHILVTTVTETEEKNAKPTGHEHAPRTPQATSPKQDTAQPSFEENWQKTLKSTTLQMPAGPQRGQTVTVWDLLFSNYITEEKRAEFLDLYKRGMISVDRLIHVLTTLVRKKEATSRKLDIKVRSTSNDDPEREEEEVKDDDEEEEEEEMDAPVLGEKEAALKSRKVKVTASAFHGREVSVWDVLHSKYIPEEKRKELLQCYKSGILTIDQMETVVTAIVNKTEEEKTKEASHSPSGSWEEPLRNHTVVLHVGEFQGQEVSLWDLLFSQYVPEAQREELFTKYRSGILSIQEMIVTLAPLLTETGGSHGGDGEAPRSPSRETSSHEKELESALRQVTMEVPSGEFQGHRQSAWELLFSKYVTADKRRELLEKYRGGSLTSEELIRRITILIEEMEEKSNKLKFSGLRRQVTASELFNSEIIDKETLSELTHGTKTVEEVTERDSVKRYLEGTSCIAGVLVPSRSDPSKTEKMTIYQAMWKGFLRPGTALVLLEAQAATGFMTDPLKNEKLSVDEAVSAELVGAELKEKLLSAERAVTGYNDPYTGNKISLFQAMKKGLIVKDHGIRLLEAQIATGGIIDPVQSHRLPVNVAYKRGFFDEEMNRVLSDPSDDTKGFFDPNTHENLTYLQLRHRCLPDPETGLLMLQVLDKGSFSFYLNDRTRKALQSAKTRVGVGLFEGQDVSAWDLLFSRYISPHKRMELLKQYKAGTLTLEEITHILVTTVTETEEKNAKPTGHEHAPRTPQATSPKQDTAQPSFEENWQKTLKSTTLQMPAGPQRGQTVTVWDLLFSNYITEEKRAEFLDLYKRGMISVDRLIHVLTTLVRKKEATSRKLDIKVRSTSNDDPEREEEEVKDDDEEEEEEEMDAPVLGEKEAALKSRKVKVTASAFHGREVSVWDVLHSKYIPEEKRKELLQCYKSGILTIDQMETVVTAIVNKTEEEKTKEASHSPSGSWEEPLRNHTVVLHVGEFQGQEVSLWDLLFSQYVPEAQREELFTKYRSGILSIQEMIVTLAPLLTETGGSHGRDGEAPRSPSRETSSHEKELESALRQVTMEVPLGEFQGHRQSAWELLFSKYVTADKRRELLEKYRGGSLTSEELIRRITILIEEMEEKSNKLKFSGLRRQVTASELFNSEIIDKETLSELTHGTKTVEEVTERDSVKRYLEGTSCIAGVLVPSRSDPSKMEKMTIYQAMWKGFLRPGTALVLLEAQAATGFMTDPLKNEKLSVDEAVSAELVGAELKEKLLSAERAVTGYNDPYTGNKISLFQAMKKGLIVKDHGIRLLEAQIATGGIIDPVQSHRLPVNVAYKRGFFDEEMNRVLSDPSDDTKGFFDPNTHENLTYLQLRHRCLPDPETGLLMLQVLDKGSFSFYLNDRTRKALQSAKTRVGVGLFEGQDVSAWDLLFSRYISPHKRMELLKQYKAGTLTLEEITHILVTTVTETEEKNAKPTGHEHAPRTPQATSPKQDTAQPSFEENWQKTLKSTTLQMPAGPQRGQTVTVWDLLFSNYITEEKRAEFLDLYKRGMISVDRLIHVLTTLVRKKEATSRKLDIKVRSTSKDDPEREEEEVKDDDEEEEEEEMDAPVLGEKEAALKSRKVKVTASAFHGREVSVWDMLHSKYIPEEKRKELLQCYKSGILTIDQMETVVTAIVNKTEEEKTKEASHSPSGSWEEPLRNHSVVLHVGEFQGQEVSLWDLLFSQYVPEAQREELFTKYRSGILSIQEMIVTLAPLLTETGGSHGGDGEAPRSPSRETSSHEKELESALRRVTMEVPSGEFQGHRQSAWELLFSKYVTTDKRRELLEKYRGGSLTSEELVRRITILIEEMEEKSNKLKFSGLRRQVTASELFNSEIIDKETLSELTHGTKTVEEVTERDSVKRYLEGTSCIAGVLVPSRSDPSKTEKMTIYQAMWKGFLRAGTALVLLEAQAATGFMTDPLKNEKLSVDEAVSAELVGAELKEKLLSAERAVTGYNDPYTGNKISLFQAMKKGLIVKDHGIRLLEAQIATGGIIDPVQSHRLPVNVAYKRGFFDEEMNRVLSDPSDDTKGFFDPNTHENLTYLQLRHRCLPDPETGLLMLQVLDKGSFSFYLNDSTKKARQSAKTRVGVGLFEGQDVSAWDLLFSRYISPHKRMELLKQYKAGTLTLEEITHILVTTVTETEEKNAKPTGHEHAPRTPQATSPKQDTAQPSFEENWQKTLKSTTLQMPAGPQRGQTVTVWDLLFSNYITEEKRAEFLDLYKRGMISVDRLIHVLTTLVTKKEATSRKLDIKVRSPSNDDPEREQEEQKEVEEDDDDEEEMDAPELGEKEAPLKSRKVKVTTSAFHGREVSVWDVLHSKYIPEEKRKELLQCYKSGILTIDQMETVVTAIVNKTEEEKTKEASHSPSGSWEEPLRNHTVVLHVGEFQGQEVSLWDLLFSQYVPEAQREELFTKYRSGILSIQEMIVTLTALLTETGECHGVDGEAPRSPSRETSLCEEELENALQRVTVEVPSGEFQGHRQSAWELLFSRYISPHKRMELLKQYKAGTLTLEEITHILVTTVPETEERNAKPTGHEHAPCTPQATSPKQDTAQPSFEENWQKTLKSTTLQMPAGPQRGQTVTVWDLLFSNYITEEKRAEFLDLYKRGMISVDRLIHVLTTLVRKMEATSRKLDIKVRSTSNDDPEREEEEVKDDDEEEEEEEMDAPVLGEKEVALKSRKVKVTASAFHGREVSVWDVLHSKYIPEEKRKELLQCYKSGILTIDQMETVVTAIVNKTEEEKTKEASHSPSGSWEEPLRNHSVVLHVGEFQGQEVSLWDLLFSQYVPEAQREELFTKYRSGILSIQEMIVTLAPLLTETGGSHGGDGEAPRSPSRETSSHEKELESALRQVTMEVPSGEFKGHRQSAWELLFSKYVTTDKRRELLEKYRGGSLTSEELVRRITILIEEMEEKSNKLKFSGLRRQVTASELFNSEIIDKETLSELTHGTKTVEEVTERDSVKRYLEGTSCIAGVLVPSRSDPSKMEKMTIYQAMWKGFLRPGTALVLLEAQAATGFMTDPLKNEKLSVDEAVSAELVGAELKEKLLSAERAVTGYNDPYTGNKISLFQAMKKGLIVKDHGIRLLEAQIATGGIIDPVQSHRLPVNVAYKRGFFDEEMNRVLSDPSDDTKGFFDPNTHENLTYLQLRHRCLPDPETGLLMLQVLDKGSFSFYLNDSTKKALQSAKTRVGVGLFEGQDVSAWDLLFSRYISPHKRMELLKQYKAGTLTLEDFTHILVTTVTETEEKNAKPTGHEHAPRTPQATSPKQDTAQPSFEENWQKTLKSTTLQMPAGPQRGQTVTVWDLLFSNYITEEKRAEFLDLYKRGMISVDRLIHVLTTLVRKKEATSRKLDIKVRSTSNDDPEQEEEEEEDDDDDDDDEEEMDAPELGEKEVALKSRKVKVTTSAFHGREVSVWDVLHSKYIPEEKRKELLQLYKSGVLTIDQMETVVTAIVNKTEEEKTKEASHSPSGSWEEPLRNHTVVLHVGEFQGQEVSLWDLLFSLYISEGKREELLSIYRNCQLTPEELAAVLSTLITEMSEQGNKFPADNLSAADMSSSGTEEASLLEWEEKEKALKSRMVEVTIGEFRGQKLSVWDILHSKYIPEEKQKELLKLYKSGILTIDQVETVATSIVTKTEEHPERTSHLSSDTTEQKDIEAPESSYYDLLQHTLRLKNIDVTIREVHGQKASVWDPFFSRFVSNIRKEEIVHRHGAPTVSVKESIQSITTLITEPAVGSGTPCGSKEIPTEDIKPPRTLDTSQAEDQEKTQDSLKSRLVNVSIGQFHEPHVSLWDLLHSHYIPEEKRKELLQLYQSGILTIDQMETVVTSIINRTEEEKVTDSGCVASPKQETRLPERDENVCLSPSSSLENMLRSESFVVPVGEFKGQMVSCWNLLSSKYISEEKKQELLNKCEAKALSVQELIGILTNIITKMEKCDRDQPASAEGSLTEEHVDSHARQQQLRKSLRTTMVHVTAGEYKGQKVCVLDLLFSKYVPQDKRQELLELYRAGTLSIQEMISTITAMIDEVESKHGKHNRKTSCRKGKVCWKDQGAHS